MTAAFQYPGKIAFNLFVLIATSILGTGCQGAQLHAEKPVALRGIFCPMGERRRVALEIWRDGERWGNLVFELDRDKAPITTDNFVRYVNEHYYDGTIIHRVTTGPRIHVLQGGGYTALNAKSKPGQHKPIQNEAKNGLKNVRGTIAMARDAAPHTATSEFFVNLKDNPSLDYPGRDGWGYCVFGKLVAGEDVLDRIAAIETRVNPDPELKGEKSQPIHPPVVYRATIQRGR